MTDDEIIQQIDRLNVWLGTIHSQINDIANLEAAAALARSPLPYSNPALTARKDSLVELSSKIIDSAQRLHDRLVNGPDQ